jgi:3-hydroxyacyl-[acyl-carrier-protein] dehydratase
VRYEIDRARDSAGCLSRDVLGKLLDYGDGFLFVDAVTELTPSVCRGRFIVPADAPYVRAHFLHLPVMPGALIAESLGQVGVLLFRYAQNVGESRIVSIGRIIDAAFQSFALPGEVVEVCAQLRTGNSRAAKLTGHAHAGGRTILQTQMTLIAVDRDALGRGQEMQRDELEPTGRPATGSAAGRC